MEDFFHGQVALMVSCAGLMRVIAARMWQKAADTGERMPATVFAAGRIRSPPLPRIAVILHFNATAAVLKDEVHEQSPAGGSNPNHELVENLFANGVKVWVCGQSVVRGDKPLSDVLPGIRGARSAMTFNINRPADGWTAIGVYSTEAKCRQAEGYDTRSCWQR